MTLQVGCDVCQIAGLEQMLQSEPGTAERLFNPEEHQYALSKGRQAEHLAGIFAAKEALAKAVREPSLLGKYYREVTVSHRENGTPHLLLSDRLSESLSAQGIHVADCSISHDGDYAVAVVLIECRPLRCDRCQMPLSVLNERGVSDHLLQVVNKEGKTGFLCSVCCRGW